MLLHTLYHPYHFVLRCAHWTCPCRRGGGGAAAGGGGEEGEERDAVAICRLRHRVMQHGFELRAGKRAVKILSLEEQMSTCFL